MGFQEFDLPTICEQIIDSAHTIGVRVVDHIDPVEYGKFLEERAKIVEEELAEIKAAKEAKLLRAWFEAVAHKLAKTAVM